MENIKFDEDLFFINLEAQTKEDVLKKMAEKLLEKGYVKVGYLEALLNREKRYPTGLPSGSPAIAIPHANADLVNKTTIAVATLNKPVTFYNMGDVLDPISVEIVIMLVISEPHSQLEMLQKVVGIVQDDESRKQLMLASDKEHLVKLITNIIK